MSAPARRSRRCITDAPRPGLSSASGRIATAPAASARSPRPRPPPRLLTPARPLGAPCQDGPAPHPGLRQAPGALWLASDSSCVCRSDVVPASHHRGRGAPLGEPSCVLSTGGVPGFKRTSLLSRGAVTAGGRRRGHGHSPPTLRSPRPARTKGGAAGGRGHQGTFQKSWTPPRAAPGGGHAHLPLPLPLSLRLTWGSAVAVTGRH